MKIIDAHNHPDWHSHNLDKFLANMDRYGIEKTWILSWECGPHEYSPEYAQVIPSEVLGSREGPIPFTRCLSYKERAPERFVLGYCPDPRKPDAAKRLQAAHEIYGAQVCGEFKCRMMYDDPDVILLFRLAGELGMPVTFHLQYDFRKTSSDPWTEWWGGTIDSLERLLQACPDTRFLGHAPGFWIHISGDDLYKTIQYPPDNAPVLPGGRTVELLEKYPNLYCDISAGSGCRALKRDPDFARKFLTEYQDRVLYARDYFDNQHQEFLNSLGLPESVLRKIYALNAEKLTAGA
ncbi:MAG: Amidohydrolase [Lentisphaerae bacterium ADurb.Bin242]|nr:MAG: Amidohydrolase [Lentisphaerae bacterium ADurb.Bin242]